MGHHNFPCLHNAHFRPNCTLRLACLNRYRLALVLALNLNKELLAVCKMPWLAPRTPAAAGLSLLAICFRRLATSQVIESVHPAKWQWPEILLSNSRLLCRHISPHTYTADQSVYNDTFPGETSIHEFAFILECAFLFTTFIVMSPACTEIGFQAKRRQLIGRHKAPFFTTSLRWLMSHLFHRSFTSLIGDNQQTDFTQSETFVWEFLCF